MSPQRTIAHYRITAKLGQAAWAKCTKLRPDVAIKILPPRSRLTLGA